MSQFDINKFLVENKLTTNSKIIKEVVLGDVIKGTPHLSDDTTSIEDSFGTIKKRGGNWPKFMRGEEVEVELKHITRNKSFADEFTYIPNWDPKAKKYEFKRTEGDIYNVKAIQEEAIKEEIVVDESYVDSSRIGPENMFFTKDEIGNRHNEAKSQGKLLFVTAEVDQIHKEYMINELDINNDTFYAINNEGDMEELNLNNIGFLEIH